MELKEINISGIDLVLGLVFMILSLHIKKGNKSQILPHVLRGHHLLLAALRRHAVLNYETVCYFDCGLPPVGIREDHC